MGLMTLSDFQADLQAVLGNKGHVNARLNTWINQGYSDLLGSVDFEITDEDTLIPTVIGTQTVTTPVGTMEVKLVRNDDGDYEMGWLPKHELMRRPKADTGAPLWWTRHGGDIYLHPIPDAVVDLFVVFKKEADPLSAASDVTVLPPTWDTAVFQLACHHALLVNGQEQKAAAWLQRAITYISTRITEEDLRGNAPGLGATIPGGVANLTSRLQEMQGAQ